MDLGITLSSVLSPGMMPTSQPFADTYLSHTDRLSNAEKQPNGPGPEGCEENGPTAAWLVGHVSIQICFLLTRRRRPILIATKTPLFRGPVRFGTLRLG